MAPQSDSISYITRRHFFKQAAGLSSGFVAFGSLLIDLFSTDPTGDNKPKTLLTKRTESVKRHHQWQAKLDQEQFFNEVFALQQSFTGKL